MNAVSKCVGAMEVGLVLLSVIVGVIKLGLMTVVSKCVGVIEMGHMTVVSVWVSLKWGL
jgi:hypothetical protein